MGTTRLNLYNGALSILGERRLASLSENRGPRHHLDQAWSRGVVDYCLEAGQWKFATRTQMLDYAPSITPPDGMNFAYAFDKPADCRRLIGVYGDGQMVDALRDYREEAGYWWANLEAIYVRFVSNDAQYGGDLSLWSQRFAKYVEAHLAYEVAMDVTGAQDKADRALKLRERLLLEALSMDAQQDPTKTPAPGGWVRARMGSSFRGREQG